jgi:hypothetical protein
MCRDVDASFTSGKAKRAVEAKKKLPPGRKNYIQEDDLRLHEAEPRNLGGGRRIPVGWLIPDLPAKGYPWVC